mmetsp:Transcript_240/g.385  ORF Transcript_240/g.385 Transcript_240/m.385 type:complete len:226 (+) Transcript_240:222-899(+)
MEDDFHHTLRSHLGHLQEPAARFLHLQLVTVRRQQMALHFFHKLQGLFITLHVVVQQGAEHLQGQLGVRVRDHLGLLVLEGMHDAQGHESRLEHHLAVIINAQDHLHLLVEDAKEVCDTGCAQLPVGPGLGLILQIHHQDVQKPFRHVSLHALDVADHEVVQPRGEVRVGARRGGQLDQALLQPQPAQRLHVLADELHDPQRPARGEVLCELPHRVHHNGHVQVV